MGFITWIVNRRKEAPADKPQPQPQENAKQMYAREAGREKANQKSINELPADQRSQVEEIKEKLDASTKHIAGNYQSLPQATQASGDSPEAAQQKMSGQNKAAPAQSPTSAQAGKTEKETPSRQPEKAPERPQSVPRHKPSWER